MTDPTRETPKVYHGLAGDFDDNSYVLDEGTK